LSGYGKNGKHEVGVHVAYDAHPDKIKDKTTNTEKEGNHYSAALGYIHKLDDKTSIKAKVDQDTNLALAFKHKHNNKFLFTLGTSVPLNDPGKILTHRLVPIVFGAQLEFFLNWEGLWNIF